MLSASVVLALTALWMSQLTPTTQASACAAQDNYTGPEGGAWSAPSNWSKSEVPASSETACIPAGKGTIVVGAKVSATAKTLLAQSALQIADEGTLAIAETAIGAGTASSFAGLQVQEGGHLSTADGWLFLSGNVEVDGEISQTKSGEALVRLLSGTLVGNGTIDVSFNNEGGTIEPGGAATIGELHFGRLSSQSAGGTLILDVASASSFDQMSAASNFFWFGTLEVNLLGGYDPPAHTTWEFMSKGPGNQTTFETTQAGYTAYSEPGASVLERLPVPPTAVTEPATAITQTSAILNGSVNPNGTLVNTCEFQYGTTISYGSTASCTVPLGSGLSPIATHAEVGGLAPGTTYHFRIVSKNETGPSEGIDRTFTTAATAKTSTSASAQTPSTATGTSTATAKATEEVLLGCSKSELVLNDAYIHGSRVLLMGSAARSLAGQKVKILFNEKTTVATTTVGADGQFSTTAPLPPAKIREALSTRYSAQIGSVRSLHLKLTRRLLLEPPKASGDTVTLTGKVTKPLTKPVTPIVVEQELECGKVTIVKRFMPAASGSFHILITVPAGTKAAIFTLKSKVAANSHALKKGFTTYSLPLPVSIG